MIVPQILGYDSLGRDIHDVTLTANRGGVMRAERVDRMALVLKKLVAPVTRFDGKRVSYCLEDMVLSQDEDNELACVKANDFNYYSAKELEPFLKGKKPLFSFLTVF
jgi:hypothetical protein